MSTSNKTTAKSYPVGTVVVFAGLQAAEYNGRRGVVQSTVNVSTGRQAVEIMDGSNKTIGLKPTNLKLAPRQASSLSIKELKYILEQMDDDLNNTTTAGLDKSELVEAVSRISTPEENAKFLLARLQEIEEQAASSSTTSSSKNAVPSISKEQLESSAERMSNMDPAQLRQQAAMIRAMDPAQLRRMNPAMMGHMNDAQIAAAAAQMEQLADNPALMRMTAQQMKHMTPEQLRQQQQQAATMGAGNTTTTASRQSTPSSSSAAAATTTTASPTMDNAADMLGSMTPEQLQQQADMLKSMDPATLRSLQPQQFGNMSDEQIKAVGEQMQMLANNPAMARMAAEQIKHMSKADLEAAMHNGPMPPTHHHPMDPAKAMQNMDGGQLKQMLQTVKDNPDLLKGMLPAGTSAEHVQAMAEKLSALNEQQLEQAVSVLTGIQRFTQPAVSVYQRANRMVGGYLVLKLIFVLLLAFIARRYYFAAATTESSSSLPLSTQESVPTIEYDEDDEF